MAHDSSAYSDARIDIGAVTGAVVKRLPRILLVTLVLLALTFVVLMFLPRLYESSASILVEPRSNSYSRASNEAAPSVSGNEAGVVSSQIELIKSRDTLLQVIDQLDLRSVPEFNGSQGGFSPMAVITQLMGRQSAPVSVDETVLNTLYSRLTVVQERDSRLISVLVRSTNPQRAADIANAIANAHVSRRAQLSISDTAEASTWLRDEIARLRLSVQEAETAVAQFKVDNDLFTGQNNTSLLDQQLSTIATQINSAQERKNTALSRAALIRGLIERGQPIEGVSDVRASVVIQQLSQEKAQLQGERAQRSATLLASHPAIRAIDAQIIELDRQIRSEGQRVASALEAEAQIEADLETSLQADLTRAKTEASVATKDTVALDGLQREAKAQRDLLEAYLLRYNEASSRVETNSALPDVRVVSVAAPSVNPAFPQTALIMLAVGLVSFMGQIGAIIFRELMSGRAVVETQQVEPQVAAAVDHAAPINAEDEAFHEATPLYEAPAMGEPHDVEDAPDLYEAPDIYAMPERPTFAHARRAADVEEPVLASSEDEPELPMFKDDEAAVVPDAIDHQHAAAASSFMEALMSEPEYQPRRPAKVQPQVVEPEPVAAAIAASEPAPQPRRAPRRPPVIVQYDDLASDLVLGRSHLLLLADHSASLPSRYLAEDLVRDSLAKGLSVALVDAGTGRQTEELGLTDLSTGEASFGDIVQKSADNSFAEISWGQGLAIDAKSSKPLTLVDALCDIYEVVVVLTGRVGRQSSLYSFAELEGRIILVAGEETDIEDAEFVRGRLMDAGLPRVEVALLAESVAA